MKRLERATPSSIEESDDREQDDRSQQRDQHGRDVDCVIDCPNAQHGAEEVTGQERAKDTDDDIEQQALL